MISLYQRYFERFIAYSLLSFRISKIEYVINKFFIKIVVIMNPAEVKFSAA